MVPRLLTRVTEGVSRFWPTNSPLVPAYRLLVGQYNPLSSLEFINDVISGKEGNHD